MEITAIEPVIPDRGQCLPHVHEAAGLHYEHGLAGLEIEFLDFGEGVGLAENADRWSGRFRNYGWLRFSVCTICAEMREQAGCRDQVIRFARAELPFGAARAAEFQCRMTRERLAELAELNVRTLQKIEAGQVNVLITTAARLVKALRCSFKRVMLSN